MSSNYSVVQYIPDPITDERINIGVIAFDGQIVRVRFLSKWDRVRQFANQDIRFLQIFAQEFTDSASPALFLPSMERLPSLQYAHIVKAQKWINSIQLTDPRGSLKSVDDLVNDTAARFLSEPIRNKRTYRDRRAAASLAKSRIRHALSERVGDEVAEDLLSQTSLHGKRQYHTFDAVVANGIPYFAAHGISFELPEAKKLHMQVDAVAWAIADVRDSDRTLPIGVMTLPPREGEEDHARLRELYQRTIKVYTDLGASILTEENVRTWAETMVQRIPV